MSEYQPEQTETAVVPPTLSTLRAVPQHCRASMGSGWLSRSFDLYKAHIGIWIALLLIYGVVAVVPNQIPGLDIVTSLLSFVWAAGLMVAAREAAEGRGPEIGHLFAGFKRRFGSLVLLALVSGFLTVFIMVAVVLGILGFDGVMAFVSTLDQGGFADGEGAAPQLIRLLLAVAIIVVALLPLIMATLFAEALVYFHDMGVVEAMKTSFVGCLRNLGSLTVWSLWLLLLMLVALIPLGLGLLVVVPMAWISLYLAYRDIFVEPVPVTPVVTDAGNDTPWVA